MKTSRRERRANVPENNRCISMASRVLARTKTNDMEKTRYLVMTINNTCDGIHVLY